MEYYNSAALAGGSSFLDNLDGATMELTGGWAVPQSYTNLNWPILYGNVMSMPGVQAMRAEIMKRYGIADGTAKADTLGKAIVMAFAMDTAMMTGDSERAKMLTDALKARPAFKKIYNYVRRKAHLGGTTKPKMSKADKQRMIARMRLGRLNRREALSKHDWYGSDPYLPGTSTRAGTYRYLYPSTYTPRARVDLFNEPIRPKRVLTEEQKQKRALKQAEYWNEIRELMNRRDIMASPSWTVPAGYFPPPEPAADTSTMVTREDGDNDY